VVVNSLHVCCGNLTVNEIGSNKHYNSIFKNTFAQEYIDRHSQNKEFPYSNEFGKYQGKMSGQ
jgi:hypothetical protein